MKYRFAEMIWYEIKEAAEQDRVAVLPVATYEDHGPPPSGGYRRRPSVRRSVNGPCRGSRPRPSWRRRSRTGTARTTWIFTGR